MSFIEPSKKSYGFFTVLLTALVKLSALIRDICTSKPTVSVNQL